MNSGTRTTTDQPRRPQRRKWTCGCQQISAVAIFAQCTRCQQVFRPLPGKRPQKPAAPKPGRPGARVPATLEVVRLKPFLTKIAGCYMGDTDWHPLAVAQRSEA
jgi:hypothetical protein